jgi:hypothetical protein
MRAAFPSGKFPGFETASQFILSRFFRHLNLGADVNNKFKAEQFFSVDSLVLAGCENTHRTKAPLCFGLLVVRFIEFSANGPGPSQDTPSRSQKRLVIQQP